jgi:hypothetical protein
MNETSESARFAARLSLHEFLLEQLAIRSYRGKAWSPTTGTTDPLEIQSATIALAENFCAKVRERLAAR